MPCSWSHAGTWINRYKKYYCQAACPKFSGLLLRNNMRGTNVARLRISVWFVGNPELIQIGTRARSWDAQILWLLYYLTFNATQYSVRL
jgi:hypothetical protein